VPARRFPYRIHLAGDQAVVTMDCGARVYRCRTMPLWFLRSIMDLCRTCGGALGRYRDVPLLTESVPAFPDYTTLASLPFGPCAARVIAARDENGALELSIAFYDAGDETAPALLLTEEQISEFADAAETLLDNAAG
jgi:hypothetical protein